MSGTTYTNGNGVSFIYTPPVSGLFGSNGSLVIQGNGVDQGSYTISRFRLFNRSFVQTSDGTTLVANVAGATDYFDVPGATQEYDLLASLGGAVTFHIGGNATVDVGISALSAITIDADGGGAFYNNTASALTALTVNLSDHGAFTVGYSLLGLINGSTINFGTNGGFFVVNGGGNGLINLTSLTINGFDTHAVDYIDDQDIAYSNVSHYSIMNSGATQIIDFTNAAGTDLGSIQINGNSLHTGNWTVSDPSGGLTLSADALGDLLLTPNPCFLRGAMIRAAGGEIPVEDLRIGDVLLAYVDGQAVTREVTWIGSRRATIRQGLPDDVAEYPVRICRDAIAEGRPHQDLLVTSEHSIFIDGMLIPARMLVNGVSIFYDRSIVSYEYFHVETTPHSIIEANGILTESYLDTGNRRSFAQPGTTLRFPNPPLSWELDAAAPLATDRLRVEPIWRQLAGRAGRNADALAGTVPLTTDTDLCLVTDGGIEIRPMSFVGNQYSFCVPSGCRSVRLSSRASRPCDTVGPFLDDRRRLGILVGTISIENCHSITKVDSHLSSTGLRGWHDREADSSYRWTDGNADLPLTFDCSGPLLLTMEVVSGGPYVLEERGSEEGRHSERRAA
jgi:hypothetical protein